MDQEDTVIHLISEADGSLHILRSQLRPLVQRARVMRAAKHSVLLLERLATTCPEIRADLEEVLAANQFADRVYAALLSRASKDGTVPITRTCLEKLYDEGFSYHALMQRSCVYGEPIA